jgi:hypothetical protein
LFSTATVLSYLLGRRCDENGNFLPPGAPPPPADSKPEDGDYFPYESRAEFELADFLFRKDQMSGGKINELMDLWVAFRKDHYGDEESIPPFANAQDLYNVIDGTKLGDVPWQAFSVKYDGDIPHDAPKWMSDSFEVWFRDPLSVMENQIGNRDFGPNEMDYAPKQVFSGTGKRQFSDLMSGDWAWNQAVCNVSGNPLI